jgi:hypothetical protein
VVRRIEGKTPPLKAEVLTQHNDDRIGWNQRESILTPASVSKSFGTPAENREPRLAIIDSVVLSSTRSGSVP